MSNETKSLDQFEILRALISELTEQSISVRDAVGIMRVESKDRHGETRTAIQELSVRVDSVVGEVESLKKAIEEIRVDGHRVDGVVQEHGAEIANLKNQLLSLSTQVGQLRTEMLEDRSAFRRAFAESTEARKSEMQAIENHMRLLEGALNTSNERGERRDSEMAKVAEAVGAVVEELGIAHRVELGRTSKGDPAPIPKLEAVDKRSKNAQVIQAVIAIGVLADTLVNVIKHYFP